jgi:hypothetical protein
VVGARLDQRTFIRPSRVLVCEEVEFIILLAKEQGVEVTKAISMLRHASLAQTAASTLPTRYPANS